MWSIYDKFRESQNEQPSQQLTLNELRDFIPQTPVVGVNDNNDDTVSNDDREDCNDALSMTVDLYNNDSPINDVSFKDDFVLPGRWLDLSHEIKTMLSTSCIYCSWTLKLFIN